MCRAGLPVPFDTFHRDDQPAAVHATTGRPPVVLAETDIGPVPLLDADEVAACARSVERLVTAIDTAVAHAGIVWPTPTDP